MPGYVAVIVSVTAVLLMGAYICMLHTHTCIHAWSDRNLNTHIYTKKQAEWTAPSLPPNTHNNTGEIVPAAVFSGKNQLRIGAHLTGLVWFLIALFFPVACASFVF